MWEVNNISLILSCIILCEILRNVNGGKIWFWFRLKCTYILLVFIFRFLFKQRSVPAQSQCELQSALAGQEQAVGPVHGWIFYAKCGRKAENCWKMKGIYVDCILKQIGYILDVTRMRKTWILSSYFTCKIFSPVVMGAASATIKRFSHSYTIKYLSTPFYNQARCKCVRLEVLIAPKT